ncbi:hypothetical protein Gohar_028391, partial [Gossypium harknessii]|nr:hypothetical protein [Gossypium harknessii]
ESKGPKSDERRTSVAIYFDAAFDQQLLRSALGLVVRNVGVKYWLPSQSSIPILQLHLWQRHMQGYKL